MAASDEPDWVFRDRHPERGEVYARMDALSDAARGSGACIAGIPYGAHPREAFELFPAAPGAPLVVFIHGGYWQSLTRERFAFVATPLRAAGFAVALPSYPLAPDRRLGDIVASADRSVDAIIAATIARGERPSGWFASGHSAGGHLALLAARRPRAVPLLGVVALSPICDIGPLQGTSLDAALSLSEREIADLSPLRLEVPAAPVRLFVGEDETPGFRNQARDYAEQARKLGHDCSAILLPERNHYTIPLEIERPLSLILSTFNELAQKPAGREG